MGSKRRFRFDYTGVRVLDMDVSIHFYTEVLGMELVGRGRTDETKGEWAQLKSKGSSHLLELNWYDENSPFYSKYSHGEELDHLCFSYDFKRGEFDRLLKEVGAKGIKIVAGPHVIGDWKLVYISDPNGIWIELGERI